MKYTPIGIIFASVLILSTYLYSQVESSSSSIPPTPLIRDTKLQPEVVFTGIQFPTSMAFLGPDDILVLEKNTGKVRRIVNGSMLPDPVLDVNVATKYERGMLGIEVSSDVKGNRPKYVFVYYTESAKDEDDITDDRKPFGNRLYRYELVSGKLVNPKLLLDLPVVPGPIHNGGKIRLGPDNNLYLTIGDVKDNKSKIQNFINGSDPDGRGGILRITQEGKPLKGIIGEYLPLKLYYAYGIRNSFGIDFDPITGKLWDTENGPAYGDEINRVEPGFNSGWRDVQGIWVPKTFNDHTGPGDIIFHPSHLVNFDTRGTYIIPEFTWRHSVGVTSIKFFSSDKYGEDYKHDMFVGDFHNGNLYHFELDENRTRLILNGDLQDRVANNSKDLEHMILGSGFGGITDLEVGPDGYLYILSTNQGAPSCYANAPPHFECISYSSSINGTISRLVSYIKN